MDTIIAVGLVTTSIAYVLVGQKSIDSSPILKGPSAFVFEITEIIALVVLITYTTFMKQYIATFVFILALIEHFRQITQCKRQAARSPRNFLTLVNYLLVIAFAISKKWWVSVAALIIGILIHITVIITNRSFMDTVCIRN